MCTEAFNPFAWLRPLMPNQDRPQAAPVPTTITEKADQQAAPMASAESTKTTASARRRLRMSTPQTSATPSGTTPRAGLGVPGL